MERSLHKKHKRKPQLVIETSDSNTDNKSFKRKPQHKNQVDIKPLMSAKNRHELKSAFSFPSISQTPLNQNDKHQVKVRFLQKLQNEKTELMRSLQILKEGAVSAIIEKQEEIQKLKQNIYVESSSLSRKSIEKEEEERFAQKLSEKELQLKQIYQKELEEEVEELRKDLRKERIRYESELYEKEQMINSLCMQLNDSYNKIQEMEKDDKFIQQKLKNIELQNMSLLKELQTSQHFSSSQHLISSQHLNSSLFLNLSNVTQKSRHKSQISEDIYFQDVGDLSYASTIPIKKHSEHILFNEEEDYLSNSFISQRIESIREKHKHEVQQIKEHYETEMSRLKKMYENQQLENSSARRKNSEHSNSLKRMGSVQSLRSIGSYHESEQNRKISRFQKSPSASTLSRHPQMKPLSLETLNLQQRMQSIIQHGEYDQAGTPRYSLKDQIMQQQIYPSSSLTYQNYDTITNVSNLQNYFNNKNSQQRNLNYDTISQFTANHFQYPMNLPERDTAKLFLRTNSIATFEGFTDDAQTKTTKKINSLQDKITTYELKDKVLSKSPSNILSVPGSDIIDHKFVQHSESQEDDDKLSTKSQASSNKSSKSTLKKDIMLFCVGLVTGGTLIGMGNKIFNR